MLFTHQFFFQISVPMFNSMEISSPPGNIIGRIQEESTIFTPDFAVQNSNGEKLLRVKGGTFTSGFRVALNLTFF